jgi:hypothetical protein
MEQVFAELSNPILPDKIGKSIEGGTIVGGFISSLVGILLIVAFIFALIFLLIGGISWITSNGEKSQLESARNKITHALIGLIIVAAGYSVFTLAGKFIGVDPKKITIPTFDGSKQ